MAAFRFGIIGPEAAVGPAQDVLPLLIAIGFLCVVGLTRREHRTIAWLATIGATFVLTIDIATYARAMVDVADDQEWQWLGIAVSLAALLAVGSAAAYGFSRPRLSTDRLGFNATMVVLGVLLLVSYWAIQNPDDFSSSGRIGEDLGSLGLVTRAFLILTPFFTGLGLLGDALPAAERARTRVALTHRGATSAGERLAAWARAFVDELSPGRSRARWAVLSERKRFARDIHADVVPSLRLALTEAERGAPPEELTARLREILADVEAVGAAQSPIQLEIGGLIPALEWLAERIERRAYMHVSLEIEDSPEDTAGDLPDEVAATAFYVAALALGNAVKHAPESSVSMRVRASASEIDLSVTDDGPGITDAAIAAARAHGRRGMADMSGEAGTIGATVEVGPGPGAVGTAVTFRWRASAT